MAAAHCSHASDYQLTAYHSSIKLSSWTKECHQAIVDSLEEHFAIYGLRVNIQLFGSAVNGFGSDDCDLDMSLTLTSFGAISVDHVAAIVRTHLSVTNVQEIHAVVPLVKIKFGHIGHSYECDISLTNKTAMVNSQMLRTYCQIDQAVPIIGLLVKQWAKAMGICGYPWPNSYTWCLMVIHYLQTKDIVPYLQDIHVGRPRPDYIDGNDLYFFRDINCLDRLWLPANKSESLTSIFCGFFNYFSTYNYRESITCWKVNPIPIAATEELRVRDPFIRRKTLTHNIPPRRYVQILNMITQANHNLKYLEREGRLNSMSGRDIMQQMTANSTRAY